MVWTVGIIVIVFGLIGWAGQTLSLLAPKTAVKLGVLEPEGEMDPVFHIYEAKVMGLADMLTTWILPLSGLLMLLKHPVWPFLGLIGGGIYIYFAGLIVLGRIILKKNGKKVGSSSSITAAYGFSVIWVLSAAAMIVLSWKALL